MIRGEVQVKSNGTITIRPESAIDLRRVELGDIVELRVADAPEVPYGEWDKDALEAEAHNRDLEVTRADGRTDLDPLASDLVAALEADDASGDA